MCAPLALKDDELPADCLDDMTIEPKDFKIKFPMSSRVALKYLGKFLLPKEKEELKEYKVIWFINMLERKLPGGLKEPSGPVNDGFDTENGEYMFDLHDHMAFRFEIIKKLGKGSFGSVVQAFDHKRKEFVALKIIRNKKKLHK